MNSTGLIPIASPKRAAAGVVIVQSVAAMAGLWLEPLPAALIVCAGAVAMLGSLAALFRADRLVALMPGPEGRLVGRTASGAAVNLELLDHRVIAGSAVGMRLRTESRSAVHTLLLLPGDQTKPDLHALRVWLMHRRRGAETGAIRSISAGLP